MCGLIGLLIRDPALEDRLGALLVPMIAALDGRGPDSAGVATYRRGTPGCYRLSLFGRTPPDWAAVATALADALGTPTAVTADWGRGAVIEITGEPTDLRALVARVDPDLRVGGFGPELEVVKDVGRPTAIGDHYGIAGRVGHMAVAHTRMATESAVTADHSHPFVPSADLCVVHNGSFSNHASIRRRLEATGLTFDTDNDSEVAARYLGARLDGGDDLGQSVTALMGDMDGFFTLVVATADELSVVRDAFACKPAVVAETDAWVAVASEYGALAGLPGVDGARVFEPQPEEVHTWTR